MILDAQQTYFRTLRAFNKALVDYQNKGTYLWDGKFYSTSEKLGDIWKELEQIRS